MTETIQRFGYVGVTLVIGSLVAWALLLILIPHLMLIDYALHASPGAISRGAPTGWTFHSFLPLFDPDDNQLRSTLARTLATTAAITLLCLIVCYPIAYYLAKVATRGWLSLLMLALLVPFWVNEVLRAYAWRSLLSRNGLINEAAAHVGLGPFEFFNWQIPLIDANIALFVGLVYAYVLFMVFPIFNAIESLDRNQIEAARDLGASWWTIHRRIVIPHAKPGIASGCIVTFMLVAGSFIVPVLLGGRSSFWFTQAIESQFSVLNWNGGSAYALLLELICLVFIVVMMRVFGVTLRDITRS